ncbi:unnamed protein product [Caenorhabditis auriculariae]|uniref:Uncharacterized protein n=1 Tax=Caenorhabditis auriculariae TaxID=2777116 RepID=A0A8S1HTP3_9PELO|nr:unnamed protein product [Caenorhabditis auriculariae]
MSTAGLPFLLVKYPIFYAVALYALTMALAVVSCVSNGGPQPIVASPTSSRRFSRRSNRSCRSEAREDEENHVVEDYNPALSPCCMSRLSSGSEPQGATPIKSRQINSGRLDKTARVTKPEKHDKAEKIDKADKADKADKPQEDNVAAKAIDDSEEAKELETTVAKNPAPMEFRTAGMLALMERAKTKKEKNEQRAKEKEKQKKEAVNLQQQQLQLQQQQQLQLQQQQQQQRQIQLQLQKEKEEREEKEKKRRLKFW